jgi:inhibitor of KinA sporulation pathway (predicted exonuclease)
VTIYKDKILVVDLECTCWEGYDAPPGQENEIIEVGICTLDMPSLEIGEKRSILVRPTKSEISEFCTQLTTITPEMVEREGIAFDEACAILEKDCNSRNRLWGSWGAFDRRMFHDQCKSRQIRYPFHDKHANFKRIFADVTGERTGMVNALDMAKLEQVGTHHRGDDDALNITRLLQWMLQTKPAALRKYGF